MYTEKIAQYNPLSKIRKEQWKIMPTMNIQRTDKIGKSTGVSQGIRLTVQDDW